MSGKYLNSVNINKQTYYSCHICGNISDQVASCSKQRCRNSYCFQCIISKFKNDFSPQLDYNQDCWVCYACGKSCKCLNCTGLLTERKPRNKGYQRNKNMLDSLSELNETQKQSNQKQKIKKITRKKTFVFSYKKKRKNKNSSLKQINDLVSTMNASDKIFKIKRQSVIQADNSNQLKFQQQDQNSEQNQQKNEVDQHIQESSQNVIKNEQNQNQSSLSFLKTQFNNQKNRFQINKQKSSIIVKNLQNLQFSRQIEQNINKSEDKQKHDIQKQTKIRKKTNLDSQKQQIQFKRDQILSEVRYTRRMKKIQIKRKQSFLNKVQQKIIIKPENQLQNLNIRRSTRSRVSKKYYSQQNNQPLSKQDKFKIKNQSQKISKQEEINDNQVQNQSIQNSQKQSNYIYKKSSNYIYKKSNQIQQNELKMNCPNKADINQHYHDQLIKNMNYQVQSSDSQGQIQPTPSDQIQPSYQINIQKSISNGINNSSALNQQHNEDQDEITQKCQNDKINIKEKNKCKKHTKSQNTSSVVYKKNHHKKNHLIQTDQNMTVIHNINNTWLKISDQNLLNPLFIRNIKLRAIFSREYLSKQLRQLMQRRKILLEDRKNC